MSLNWNLSKIKDWETVCWEDDTSGPVDPKSPQNKRRLKVVTNCLIWASMSVDLGSITENNIEEWMVRLALNDRLTGTIRIGPEGEPMPFTVEELRAHIGLTTNVSTRTRKQWTDNVVRYFNKRTERAYRRLVQREKDNG